MTNPFFAALAFLLLGYLSGSLTPSIWVTRLVKGVDVRDAGSGHPMATIGRQDNSASPRLRMARKTG